MATATAPVRGVPRFRELREPDWLARIPTWASTGGLFVVLLALSAYIRTRYISGQFWMDEAITTGIASHSLTAIPGILRHDGSPPLFYLLLHFWIKLFGNTESATHSLPLLFGLLCIPAGMWAGWSLFGRRAGWYAGVLFAFSTFLTEYATETRMYELMGLLGILATAAFIHAFVYRRRKYVVMFGLCEALMLYTHAWGMFFGVGSAIALLPMLIVSSSAERRALIKDAAMAYIAAGILFLPWLLNFIYQATHTGAPWAPPPRFGAPVLISRDLLGGDRITIALLFSAVLGFAPLFTRAYRRTREATAMWTLIALPVATLGLAWIASQITPAFVSRYFAPVLASILLFAAWGAARSGIVGLIAIILSVLFVIHISNYTPQYKSDMREVGGQMTALVHQGDLVVVAQPEQTPLAYYYLPGGLRFASTIGPVKDPTYMNWVYALKRLRHANPAATLDPLIASLKPGQQLLYVRPLTEGAQNWQAAWTQLVRRRAAQWGAILAADKQLQPVAVAPLDYRGSCCVADSAVLYKKI
jgi:mannosyltransferase